VEKIHLVLEKRGREISTCHRPPPKRATRSSLQLQALANDIEEEEY
jgi:hypothetical protein